MSTAKVRKKRGGSVQGSKRLDDGATGDIAGPSASYVNTIHPKWEKIINDEARDNVTLQIREEIFESLFQICYEKYLQKQVIDFTVHCAHQAFLKVASIYFIKLDPGEKVPEALPSWEPDTAPEPSPMDPWLSHTVPVVQQEPKPEIPPVPKPSPVTEPSLSDAATPKSEVQEQQGESELEKQLCERYQPSTEWSPAAVESALRHISEPVKPKAPAESPPKGQKQSSRDERPSADSRKSKDAAPVPGPSTLKAGTSERRPSRLPPIKSKASMKKIETADVSPEPIPRPPVLPISALPPSRAEVKCTVLTYRESANQSDVAVKKSSVKTAKNVHAAVHWSKSAKSVMKM